MKQKSWLAIACICSFAAAYFAWQFGKRLLHRPNLSGFLFIGNNVDGKFAIIDDAGHPVTPFLWESATLLDNDHDRFVVVGKNSRFGVVDVSGKEIIPCEYDQVFVTSYSPVVFHAEHRTLARFMDRHGKIIYFSQHPGEFDGTQFGSYGGLWKVKRNGKYGCIDRTGKVVVNCEWDDGCDFTHESTNPKIFLATVKRKGKWGIIDSTGKLVIDCRWDWVSLIDAHRALVSSQKLDGIIDLNGEYIVPCQYDEVLWDVDVGYVAKRSGKFGLLNHRGQVSLPFVWDDCKRFDRSSLCVKENGKYGVINLDGSIRIPIRYDSLSSYDDGVWNPTEKSFAVAEFDGRFLALDRNGQIQITSTLGFMEGPQGSPLAIIKEGDKQGLIDKSGKVIIKPQYDDISQFANAFLVTKEDHRGLPWLGLVSSSGQTLVPCEWSSRGRESNVDCRYFEDKPNYFVRRRWSRVLSIKPVWDLVEWIGVQDWEWWNQRVEAVFDANGRQIWNSQQEANRAFYPWISGLLFSLAFASWFIGRQSKRKPNVTSV